MGHGGSVDNSGGRFPVQIHQLAADFSSGLWLPTQPQMTISCIKHNNGLLPGLYTHTCKLQTESYNPMWVDNIRNEW